MTTLATIKNAPALYQQPGAWVIKKGLITMQNTIRVHEFLEGRLPDAICPKCKAADAAYGNYTVTYTGEGAAQTAMLTVSHACSCGNRYAVTQPIRFSWMVHPLGDVTQVYPLAGMEDDYVDLLAEGFVPATWADVRKAYAADIRAEAAAKAKWLNREGVKV